MGLEYKCMTNMIKPTVYIDEFKSKVGDDDEYIVLSFYVRNIVAAQDLVSWFESGYKWVIDADRSQGEIEPNHYLVFVEMKRRLHVIEHLEEMLNDLETLTEHKLEDWTVTYRDEEYPFVPEILKKVLVLSPREYREKYETELNEMRVAAGLPVKSIYNDNSIEINNLRLLADLPHRK